MILQLAPNNPSPYQHEVKLLWARLRPCQSQLESSQAPRLCQERSRREKKGGKEELRDRKRSGEANDLAKTMDPSELSPPFNSHWNFGTGSSIMLCYLECPIHTILIQSCTAFGHPKMIDADFLYYILLLWLRKPAPNGWKQVLNTCVVLYLLDPKRRISRELLTDLTINCPQAHAWTSHSSKKKEFPDCT
jgi:hypothetical protein